MKQQQPKKHTFIILIAALFTVVYTAVMISVSGQITNAKQELQELQTENDRLVLEQTKCERELEYVQSEAGIKLYAHKYGYHMPNEVCYTSAASSSN